MFFILDTDHFSALDRESDAGRKLERRRAKCAGELFISIITVEEVMRGWMAALGACKKPENEIGIYRRMQRSAELIGQWDVLPWDDEALRTLQDLRKLPIRISTMDLKIASIALIHDATVLTRNKMHFQKVPGLKIENWLD